MSTAMDNATAANAVMAAKFINYANQLDVVLTANGNTAVVAWLGGKGYFTASGTFGSGTVTMQYQVDGTNWLTVGTDTTLTASGGGIFDIPAASIRAALTGATNPSIRVEASKGRD